MKYIESTVSMAYIKDLMLFVAFYL